MMYMRVDKGAFRPIFEQKASFTLDGLVVFLVRGRILQGYLYRTIVGPFGTFMEGKNYPESFQFCEKNVKEDFLLHFLSYFEVKNLATLRP